jgi:hypothetical protein
MRKWHSSAVAIPPQLTAATCYTALAPLPMYCRLCVANGFIYLYKCVSDDVAVWFTHDGSIPVQLYNSDDKAKGSITDGIKRVQCYNPGTSWDAFQVTNLPTLLL